MRSFLESLIRAVRRNSEYRLDPTLSSQDLLVEVVHRGIAAWRGQWFLLGVRGGRLRFVEGNCSVRHRRCLWLGSGSVLEYGCRLRCLSQDGIVIGERVTIGKYALIECTSVLWHLGRGLSVGDDSSIGDYSFIGCAGGVTIGNNVLMGPYVSFHSQNHRFADNGQPIRLQGVSERGITVEDDCWLGSGATILDGVTVGRGSIVAAGAVVTKSFPAMSIIGGVPATRIGDRGGAGAEVE